MLLGVENATGLFCGVVTMQSIETNSRTRPLERVEHPRVAEQAVVSTKGK
jgi:hypothetical protein